MSAAFNEDMVNQVNTRLSFCYEIILLVLFSSQINGKIIRHETFSDAEFTVLSTNKKLRGKYVIGKYNGDVYECVTKCVKERKCQSINHNSANKLCEILNATGSAVENRWTKSIGWTHYETDRTAKKIGPYCNSQSPCPRTHVCEDTFSDPPYSCRCEEHYRGDLCETYDGPGSKETLPAISCNFLSKLYKTLKNDYYWLHLGKGNDGPMSHLFCNIRGAEAPGKTKEAAIKSCNWLFENYPKSKSGGYWYKNMTKKEAEVKICDRNNGKIGEKLCKKYEGNGSTCINIDENVTISFNHDRENEYYSSGHEDTPENITITYESSLQLIKSAVHEFSNCIQRFYMEARNVLKRQVSMVTVNGTRLKTIDGDCHNCATALDEPFISSYRTPKTAYGNITNKSLLPLRGILIGDTGHAIEWVKITFEKLVCTQIISAQLG